MTTGYFMVFVASALPILCAAFAKIGTSFDNHAPRSWLQNLPDQSWRKRMLWAQANSWEAFTLFAPAVIIAHLNNAAPNTIAWLSSAFILFRVLYIFCYATNRATLRSVCWALAIAPTCALYFV